jgi:hsp70-interacting protein
MRWTISRWWGCLLPTIYTHLLAPQLVENIDNANGARACACVGVADGAFLDIEKLRMWEPLQGLLGSSPDGVKVQALWVIGTAMQNNPKAQSAVRLVSSRLPPSFVRILICAQYLALEPFPTLLAFLSPSSRAPAKLRSKVIYALSGLLKHHAAALESFEASGGWVALRGALSGTLPHPPSLFYFLKHTYRFGHRRAAQNCFSP